MNRRQKIIVSVVGIFIVLLALVGLTYAYFLTQVKGNTNTKSISVTTANLRLFYGGDDGSIIGDNEIIEPDTTFAPKTFTVTNTGNGKVDAYAVIIDKYGVFYNEDSVITNKDGVDEQVFKDQVTTLARPEDFKLEITCKNQDGEPCPTPEFNGILPTQSDIILINSIDVDEVHTYTATLTYVEANTNQSADMNKRIEGRFNIIGLADTIDLTGTVTNFEPGDYVQTNSTKRVSEIKPDGTYKILGLEIGAHKIKVCEKGTEDCTDDKAKIVKEINIVQGQIASGNNDTKTITITNNSRLATVNVDLEGNIIIDDEIHDYNPFSDKNSLAYNVFANAYSGKNSTVFVNSPLTKPAEQKSALKYIKGDDPTAFTKTLDNATNNYIVYASDYEINEKNGQFILGTDEHPATIMETKYLYSSELANILTGKYAYLATFKLTEEQIKNLGSLYKISTSVSDIQENTIKYASISKKTIGTEKELSQATDDYGTSYYFRGEVEDNYATFAGMCWRIVRIQGDGSTKLILEDKDEPCSASMNYNWNITKVNFGFDKTSGHDKLSYLNPVTNASSSMSTALKNFQTNKLGNYLGKLKKGDWCMVENAYANDKVDLTTAKPLTEAEKLSYHNNSTEYYFDSYIRLFSNQTKQPTLKCTGTNMYTWGDGITPMFIGTLTADEVVYAGATVSKAFPKHLHYLINKKQSLSWWTLTPSILYTGTTHAAFSVQSGGSLAPDYAIGNVFYYRPAVILAKGVTIETGGDGTINNPYVIN